MRSMHTIEFHPLQIVHTGIVKLVSDALTSDSCHLAPVACDCQLPSQLSDKVGAKTVADEVNVFRIDSEVLDQQLTKQLAHIHASCHSVLSGSKVIDEIGQLAPIDTDQVLVPKFRIAQTLCMCAYWVHAIDKDVGK